MKIAIPNNGVYVNQHFGRSISFIIATIENNEVQDIEEVSTSKFAHQHEGLANFLTQKNVKTVIAGGIGEGAKKALEVNGLTIIKGATGEYQEVLKEYLEGTLESKDISCGHEHGGHHHH